MLGVHSSHGVCIVTSMLEETLLFHKSRRLRIRPTVDPNCYAAPSGFGRYRDRDAFCVIFLSGMVAQRHSISSISVMFMDYLGWLYLRSLWCFAAWAVVLYDRFTVMVSSRGRGGIHCHRWQRIRKQLAVIGFHRGHGEQSFLGKCAGWLSGCMG